MRSCLNPETGDIVVFFYTVDSTEQKMQEQLLGRISKLDYDLIAEIDIRRDYHRVIAFNDGGKTQFPKRGVSKGNPVVAARYMDEAAGKEYVSKLDYTYMQKH